MKSGIGWVAVVAAACIWAGCQCGRSSEPAARDCRPGDKAAVMAVARDVLLRTGFQISKYDVGAGVITTRPLSGGQFFEVWRGDNADSCSAAEANLHSVNRTAEMVFAAADGTVCTTCRVNVRRLSIPERPVAGTSGAFSMFTKSSGQLATTRLNPEQESGMSWIDMGDDAALAAKLVASVSQELDRGGGRSR